MAAEVAEFFADPAQNMKVYQTVDADHRRIETRARRVSQAVDWLFSDRRYKGGPRFPGLATIAGVTSTRQIGEVTTTATRLYLASAHLTPARFAAAVRAHWAIENSLHWLLDVTFDEDRARNRMDNGPENLAILRKLTLNLLRKARPKLPYPENENAQDAPMPSQEPSSAKCDSPGGAQNTTCARQPKPQSSSHCDIRSPSRLSRSSHLVCRATIVAASHEWSLASALTTPP